MIRCEGFFVFSYIVIFFFLGVRVEMVVWLSMNFLFGWVVFFWVLSNLVENEEEKFIVFFGG